MRLLPENTPLGRLNFGASLLEFNGPRIFFVESDSHQLYIAISVEDLDDGHRWIYAPTTQEELESLVRGTTELRDVVHRGDTAWLWAVTVCSGGDHAQPVRCRDVSEDDLPEPGVFLVQKWELDPVRRWRACRDSKGDGNVVVDLHFERTRTGKAADFTPPQIQRLFGAALGVLGATDADLGRVGAKSEAEVTYIRRAASYELRMEMPSNLSRQLMGLLADVERVARAPTRERATRLPAASIALARAAVDVGATIETDLPASSGRHVSISLAAFTRLLASLGTERQEQGEYSVDATLTAINLTRRRCELLTASGEVVEVVATKESERWLRRLLVGSVGRFQLKQRLEADGSSHNVLITVGDVRADQDPTAVEGPALDGDVVMWWQKKLNSADALRPSSGQMLRMSRGGGFPQWRNGFRTLFFSVGPWDSRKWQDRDVEEITVAMDVSVDGAPGVSENVRITFADWRADSHGAPTTYLYWPNSVLAALHLEDFTGGHVRVERNRNAQFRLLLLRPGAGAG